jgi:CheY-like chemotaxis protein
MKNIIKSIGYNDITIAGNGKITIDLLNSGRYDILFLDLVMPVVDGWEVIDFIKRSSTDQFDDMKIIITTGTNTPDCIERCRKVGIKWFVKKPFNINTIKKMLL